MKMTRKRRTGGKGKIEEGHRMMKVRNCLNISVNLYIVDAMIMT